MAKNLTEERKAELIQYAKDLWEAGLCYGGYLPVEKEFTKEEIDFLYDQSILITNLAIAPHNLVAWGVGIG